MQAPQVASESDVLDRVTVRLVAAEAMGRFQHSPPEGYYLARSRLVGQPGYFTLRSQYRPSGAPVGDRLGRYYRDKPVTHRRSGPRSVKYPGQALRYVAEADGQWVALLTLSAPDLIRPARVPGTEPVVQDCGTPTLGQG